MALCSSESTTMKFEVGDSETKKSIVASISEFGKKNENFNYKNGKKEFLFLDTESWNCSFRSKCIHAVSFGLAYW